MPSREPHRSTERGKLVLFGVLVLLAWGSSGTTPWEDAVRGALAPSDLATDFVPAARIWRGETPGVEAEEGNVEAVALGVPEYTSFGTPYRAHPPPSVMLVALLVPAGWAAARGIWIALSLAAVAVLAWVSAETLSPARRRRWALVLFVLIALWPATLHDLEKGQWSLLVAALLALAHRSGQRGAPGTAGGLVALAASFKVVPIVVAAGLVSADRWRRVVAGAGATLASVLVLSMLVVGPAAWLDFFVASPINTRGWQTGLANTASLWGPLARLCVGGPYAIPALAPEDAAAFGTLLAGSVWAVSAIGLASATLRALGGMVATPLAFAAWSTLALLVNPLGWTHTAVWLVVPMAVAFGSLRAQEDDVGLTALLGALVLLTLPRQTLFELAGPAPVAPIAGLALAAHLLGALMVLSVTLRAAQRERS